METIKSGEKYNCNLYRVKRHLIIFMKVMKIVMASKNG